MSYVKSLQSLAALQDDEVDPAHVPIIQLKGLRDIALKFGLQSEELKKAQEMLSITAEVCCRPSRLTILGLRMKADMRSPLAPYIDHHSNRASSPLIPAKSWSFRYL